MKLLQCWLLAVAICLCTATMGQSATSSILLGIGRTACTSGTHSLQRFTFNPTLNTLSPTGPLCVPSLGTPGFSISRAVIDYNPKDQQLYYFRRVARAGAPTIFDTYVWRWNPATCATGSLPPIQTFLNEYLTLAFDAEGNGWMINLIPQPGGTHNLTMRKVDFTTSTIGAPIPISLPAGVNIYQANGDLLITPSGNLFFAYDNKLLTVNYQDYGVNPLNATYIDTIALPQPGQSLIGLGYANGKFVGSFVKTTAPQACGYGEIDILTGDRTNIILTSGSYVSYDNTSVASGIGVAKNLVSVTPVGPAGTYDVVYDVYVKNYGTYPVSNVQVTDDLRNVVSNAGNLLSASAALIDNPAGVAINPGYNGASNQNLLAANQTLPNAPLTNNHFTVRITARFRNVVAGVVYNNQAVATGTGFSGVALQDASTNGTNPDLNLNDKPDDPSENVVTPFVVTVASETPPCATLTTVLHNQDFGTGADQSTLPAGVTNSYTGSTTAPLAEERFVITANPNTYNTAYWNAIAGRGGSGRMMVVNADVQNDVIYSTTVAGLCSNLKYSFSAWVANLSNNAQKSFCAAVGGFKNPKLNFRIRDGVSGLVLTNISTGDITSSSWTEYGMRFVLPGGSTSLIMEIINEGEGGCGNDLAIDDIRFGLCDPAPTVTATASSAGCMGGSASLSAALSDPTVISGPVEYQWQFSTDNITFNNIAGATAATYAIPAFGAGNVGYYRALIAASGSIANASCRYTSNAYHLTAKTTSTAPTGATTSANNTCPSDAATLTVQGGSLGTNAVWRWYSGSCGGTLVGSTLR